MIATFNLSGKIADPVIHDGPRIMRLPGFINHKGGAVAQVLYQNDSPAHYDWFEFGELPEKPPRLNSHHNPRQTTKATTLTLLNGLCDTMRGEKAAARVAAMLSAIKSLPAARMISALANQTPFM